MWPVEYNSPIPVLLSRVKLILFLKINKISGNGINIRAVSVGILCVDWRSRKEGHKHLLSICYTASEF